MASFKLAFAKQENKSKKIKAKSLANKYASYFS